MPCKIPLIPQPTPCHESLSPFILLTYTLVTMGAQLTIEEFPGELIGEIARWSWIVVEYDKDRYVRVHDVFAISSYMRLSKKCLKNIRDFNSNIFTASETLAIRVVREIVGNGFESPFEYGLDPFSGLDWVVPLRDDVERWDNFTNIFFEEDYDAITKTDPVAYYGKFYDHLHGFMTCFCEYMYRVQKNCDTNFWGNLCRNTAYDSDSDEELPTAENCDLQYVYLKFILWDAKKINLHEFNIDVKEACYLYYDWDRDYATDSDDSDSYTKRYRPYEGSDDHEYKGWLGSATYGMRSHMYRRLIEVIVERHPAPAFLVDYLRSNLESVSRHLSEVETLEFGPKLSEY